MPENGERGAWIGERGESVYVPAQRAMRWTLSRFQMEGVQYSGGIPDLSPCAAHTLRIKHMSKERYRNVQRCDSVCAEEWNRQVKDGRIDWTAREVARWRSKHGYTWHGRKDRYTCDLVPILINDYFRHLGGVTERGWQDSMEQEGVFDA